jgi:hypothetical protein
VAGRYRLLFRLSTTILVKGTRSGLLRNDLPC